MPAEMVAGYQFKLTINGVRYAAVECSAEMVAADLDLTNSEGIGNDPNMIETPGNEVHDSGNVVCRVTVTTASFDLLNNPFAGPLLIIPGAYIALSYGLFGDVNPAWIFPSMKVLTGGTRSNVKALSPFNFSAVSNGDFIIPD